LFEGAMEGMVAVLNERGDEHSQFITAQQAKLFREEIAQEIGGIGVHLRFEGDPPVLQVAGPPMPGKPAARAGIRGGDQILAIDGKPTAGLTPRDFSEVLDRMRGKPNEPLQLTVLHAGETSPVVVELVRERLTLDSVRGDRLLADQTWRYQLEQDPRIALVRIISFGAKSVSELEELLPKLRADGVEAILFDLRDNPGGPLDAAVETCELFLPAEKVIVETRDREGEPREIAVSQNDGPYLDIPLAVLVNRESASASEIVAACLQDHGRAVVVGERSFGKGTVQELLPIEAGASLLKLTRASFWRPTGKNIHRHGTDRAAVMDNPDWGVTPNMGFEVELPDEKFIELAKQRADRDVTVYDPAADPSVDEPLFDDPALDVAVAYLQEQLDQ
jgi:carboxyl-terminal processing protease